MRRVSFNDLNDLSRILNKYSEKELSELLSCLDADLEVFYGELQHSYHWTITDKKDNPICGLHKVSKENMRNGYRKR